MTGKVKNKETERYLIQVIQDYDLYPDEIREIRELQQGRNWYWPDIDLSGAIYNVSDEELQRIKLVVEMAERVDDNQWDITKLTEAWSDRYINKAKQVQAIWYDVTIELLEDMIEIDFDVLRDRVKNYNA